MYQRTPIFQTWISSTCFLYKRNNFQACYDREKNNNIFELPLCRLLLLSSRCYIYCDIWEKIVMKHHSIICWITNNKIFIFRDFSFVLSGINCYEQIKFSCHKSQWSNWRQHIQWIVQLEIQSKILICNIEFQFQIIFGNLAKIMRGRLWKWPHFMNIELNIDYEIILNYICTWDVLFLFLFFFPIMAILNM